MWKKKKKSTTLLLFLDSLFPKTEIAMYMEHAVAQLVEALRYKPEGRRFYPR
jgi:hypothetical protein